MAERLDGSEGATKRLRVVLETIAGERSVSDACRELGIGEVAFWRLRDKALRGALKELEPKRPGRPRSKGRPKPPRVAELEEEVEDLKVDLRAAQIREEIALLMPNLMKERRGSPKKSRGRSRGGKRGTGRGSGGSGR
jgi:transposase-like protein